MPDVIKSLSEANSATLLNDATVALSAVQKALVCLIAEMPGEMRRPANLQHALDVDYKICWQMFSVARAPDVKLAVQNVPTSAAIRKVIAAATELGIRPSILTELQNAINEFEKAIDLHAGERGIFNSMVAAKAGSRAAEGVDLQNRRAAFRADTQLWGAQVKSYLHQSIVRLSPDGKTCEECFINIKQGLQLLRDGAMPIIQGYRLASPKETSGSVVGPLIPQAAQQHGAPLLPEFCTTPLPTFQTAHHNDGWTYSVLESVAMGRTGAVDMAFGIRSSRNPILHNSQGKRYIFAGMRFVNPTETATLELVIHRPSFKQGRPVIRTFASAGSEIWMTNKQEVRQFPFFETVQNFGAPHEARSPSAVSRYSELNAYMFSELGWDPSEFDVYRVQWTYPVLNTILEIGYILDS